MTKTYEYVHYDTRHVQRTCYACKGSGKVILQPSPPRQAAAKPSPPPTPPPTLKDNLHKRFGFGYQLTSTTVGSERLRVVTYKAKPKVTAYALIRVQGSQFEVILENYESIFLLRNEYDDFDGLFLEDMAGKYAMADDKGRIHYLSDHRFDKVNARGDIWQGTGRKRKVGDKEHREYELINYKTRERLSPGISLDDYCVCKELWTQKGLIDVKLPHAVLGDRTARGLMNREGEILVPPLYDRVLDCDPSKGMVRFMDEEGYVFDFDHLGRMLTPSKELYTESCPDGRRHIYTKAFYLDTDAGRYKEEDIKLVDRVVIHHPDNPAVDGLVFREAGCPDENGWATVLPVASDIPLYLHSSGRIASSQEKTFATTEIGKLPRVPFQPPNARVAETWFVAQKSGSLFGGRLAYRNKEGELVYRTIKTAYKQVVSRAPEQVLVQAKNGLWGILAKTASLKPKYDELYQIRPLTYLGVAKGKIFLIHFDPDKQMFKTEAASKFSTMKQGTLKKLLNYNRQVPHIWEELGRRLKNYGISPNEPMSGREIIIDQSTDQHHNQHHLAYWFSQNNRHHLFLVMGIGSWNLEYYHCFLPDGTTDVADALYLDEKKGYLYIPYREGDGPYRLIEFHKEYFKRLKDSAFEFDAVYAVPVPTDDGPHTLVFETAQGYFTLSRGKLGLTRRGGRNKELSLKLLGVK
ncbi:hypothetical protein [Seonamhaeicola aphaedonensis]|uniref:hypothetical protein n=1 Tax=Seonamhaeicola aphaedonensis TaxID=1461338 RepID=UPI0011C03E15|nr:hypothetical protein [Seonamhaeicola aphaedonensis]